MAEPDQQGPGSGRVPDPDRPPPPAGTWPLAAVAVPAAGTSGRAAGVYGTGGPATHGVAGIGLSLGAIAIYLGGQLALQLVLGLALLGRGVLDADLLDPATGGASLLGLVVASQSIGLGLVLLFLRFRGIPLAPMIGATRPLGGLIGRGVGLGLLAIVGSTIVVSVLVALTGSEATPDQVLTESLTETPLQLALAVAAAVVLAPLAEELLFRGLLHRGLRRRLALVPATVISSVVFALVHFDVLFSQPLAIVGLVLVGVVLAVAYERTGSLIVPVMIHAVHNAVTIVAVVVTARLDLAAIVPLGWTVRLLP